MQAFQVAWVADEANGLLWSSASPSPRICLRGQVKPMPRGSPQRRSRVRQAGGCLVRQAGGCLVPGRELEARRHGQ